MENKIKLLIVDDVDDNRLILRSICKKVSSDLHFYEASDGEQAVAAVRELQPEIVLMDIMMPMLDGFEATKIIKEEFPSTIVLVVTAVADIYTEEKLMKVGATGFVLKPVDKEALRLKIKAFVDFIQIQHGLRKVFSSKAPINPLAKEIRSMKTIFEVASEDELMNLGAWLLERYLSSNPTESFEFDTALELLYKTISLVLKQSKQIQVIIEEDFESLYITVELGRGDLYDRRISELSLQLKNNIDLKDGFLYLKIKIHDVHKEQKSPFLHIVEQTLPEPKAVKEEKVKVESIQLGTPAKTESVSVITLTEEETVALRMSHTNKISAAEYMKYFDDVDFNIEDKVEDLDNLDSDWEKMIGAFEKAPSNEKLVEFDSTILHPYSRVLNLLPEFMAMSYAISGLGVFLRNLDVTELDSKKIFLMSQLLQGIKDDLSIWRSNIFIYKNTHDIHYLDSSLFSSCKQIEGMLTEKKVQTTEDDGGDLEFF